MPKDKPAIYVRVNNWVEDTIAIACAAAGRQNALAPSLWSLHDASPGTAPSC